MLRILLNKQLLEINRNFFFNPKDGKKRSAASSFLLIISYILLTVGVIGGMSAYVSFTLCSPFVSAGMGWLYFALTGLMAIGLGVFGSVFNTFSGLYLAKDNDLLLSLPIPVRYILASRLLGVYLMGLMFSGVVIIPAVIVYFIVAYPTASAVAGSIILVILISLIVLILSCILGWLVAKIVKKLKNKSFITVIVSLAFLAAYYFVYFKANEFLQTVLKNMDTFGAKIKGSAYPVYLLGRAGVGDIASILILTLSVAVILALTYFILERTFIGIATSSGKVSEVKYKEKSARRKNIRAALFGKELARFTSSPTYMLNCGLGVLFLPAASVFILIKGSYIREFLHSEFQGNDMFVAALLIAAICLLSSMNDMTAPSVSLEGKNIWIAQTLPVAPWQLLRAKLDLQLIFTGVPVLFASVCASAVCRTSFIGTIFVVLTPEIFVLLSALFGLFLNLKRPNLTWTNEINPIKQSISVLIALFASFAYAVLFIVGYIFMSDIVDGKVFIIAFTLLSALISFVLYRYIKKKGAVIFASL